MLYYFPLESYKARYTCQLSAEGNEGWLESRWLENEVPYTRIEPEVRPVKGIQHGSVLDACQRGIYSCEQVAYFLRLVQENKITSDDVIYFDDIWTPGIEALPYAFHLTGIKPKMYGLLHAQSVDEFDFTFGMLPWIRHFEKGIGSILDGIFVSCDLLAELVYKQGLCEADKIHITGLPYNSDKVKEIYWPKDYKSIEKKNQVVFSSRWDSEKDPTFFLDVIDTLNKIGYQDKINFVISTSHTKLKSNRQYLIDIAKRFITKYNNVEIRENQSKEQYYRTLLESKIQFNCADQDFVSWTLLEALTANCTPVYPNFRSFPYELHTTYLYKKNDIASAVNCIILHLQEKYNKDDNKDMYFTVSKHDKCWEKMWHVMFSEDTHAGYSYANIIKR